MGNFCSRRQQLDSLVQEEEREVPVEEEEEREVPMEEQPFPESLEEEEQEVPLLLLPELGGEG